MKKMIISLFVVLGIAACSNNQSFDTSKKPDFSNQIDTASYMLGIEYGKWLKGMGPEEVNYNLFSIGAKSIVEGDSVYFNDQARGEFLRGYFKALDEKKVAAMEEEFAPQKEAAMAWLTDIATQEGVKQIEEGLFYKVIKQGNGPKPVDGDIVEVLYTGKDKDGKIFDTTSPSNETRKFSVNGVIPGWTTALKQMPTGSKWEVYISPDLAYGLQPDPRSGIEPNAALHFEVELVGVSKPKAR